MIFRARFVTENLLFLSKLNLMCILKNTEICINIDNYNKQNKYMKDNLKS